MSGFNDGTMGIHFTHLMSNTAELIILALWLPLCEDRER